MKKLKLYLLLTSTILLIIGGVTVLYYLFTETKFCGRLKYKIETTSFNKHTGHVNPVFVIDFEERGVQEIHPTWNDYMSINTGDQVCYNLFRYAGNTRNKLVALFLGCIFFTIVSFIFLMSTIHDLDE